MSLWWVVGGLAAHGIFDVFHGHMIADAGVPRWWPSFCLSFDLFAATYLAALLLGGKLRAGSITLRFAGAANTASRQR